MYLLRLLLRLLWRLARSKNVLLLRGWLLYRGSHSEHGKQLDRIGVGGRRSACRRSARGG